MLTSDKSPAQRNLIFVAESLPDLLTQVGFGILTELALSALWDVQGYNGVP